MLRPIKNHIIFQFIEEISGGQFVRKSAAGIMLPGNFDDSAKTPRWARVIATGPEVTEELKVQGCEILIENLKWTPFFKYNGEKYWRTDEKVVYGYRYPEDKDSDTEVMFSVD